MRPPLLLALSLALVWATAGAVSCVVGSYADASNICQLCPPGKYWTRSPDKKTADCAACFPGSYSAKEGAAGAWECQLCAAGKHAVLSASPICTGCPAGKRSGGAAAICSSFCEAGKYSTGPAACTDCSVGRFSGALGAATAAVCQPCTVGRQSTNDRTTCSACAAGKTSTPDLGACASCLAGKYAAAVASPRCEACAAGRHAPSKMLLACLACLPGKVSARASVSCGAACFKGTSLVNGTAVCAACPAGRFQEDDGGAPCVGCPAGKFQPSAGGIGCSVCGGNFSAPAATNCTGSCPKAHGVLAAATGFEARACVFCPAGSLRGVTPVTGEHGICVKCKSEGMCAGGDMCSAQYTGPLCAYCAPRHFRKSRVTLECEACEPLGLTAVFGVLMLVILLGSGLKLWLRLNDAKDEQMAFYSTLMKFGIFLNYIQMSWITSLVDFEWPQFMKDVFQAMNGLFTLQLGQATSRECGIFTSTYKMRWMLTTLTPLVFLGIVMALVGPLYRRFPALNELVSWSRAARRKFRRSTFRTVSFILLFFYTYLVNNAFEPLECMPLTGEEEVIQEQDSAPVVKEKLYMVADPTVRCYGVDHLWLALTSISIGIFTAVFLPWKFRSSILHMVTARYRAGVYTGRLCIPLEKKRGARGDTEWEENLAKRQACKFPPLFRTQFRHWELMLFAQKTVCVLSQKMLGLHVQLQVFFLFLANTGMLLGQFTMTPYIDKDMNLLSVLTLSADVLLLMIGSFSQLGLISPRVAGLLALALFFCVCVPFLYVFARIWRKGETVVRTEVKVQRRLTTMALPQTQKPRRKESGEAEEEEGDEKGGEAGARESGTMSASMLLELREEFGSEEEAEEEEEPEGEEEQQEEEEEEAEEEEEEPLTEAQQLEAQLSTMSGQVVALKQKIASIDRTVQKLNSGEKRFEAEERFARRKEQAALRERGEHEAALQKSERGLRVAVLKAKRLGIETAGFEADEARFSNDQYQEKLKLSRKPSLRKELAQAAEPLQQEKELRTHRAAENFEAFVFCVPDAIAGDIAEEMEVKITLHKIKGLTVSQVGRNNRVRELSSWAWRKIVDFQADQGDEDVMDMFSLKVKGLGTLQFETDYADELVSSCRELSPKYRRWSQAPDSERSHTRSGRKLTEEAEQHGDQLEVAVQGRRLMV